MTIYSLELMKLFKILKKYKNINLYRIAEKKKNKIAKVYVYIFILQT